MRSYIKKGNGTYGIIKKDDTIKNIKEKTTNTKTRGKLMHQRKG